MIGGNEWWKVCLVVAFVGLGATACREDAVEGGDGCDDGFQMSPVTGECVPASQMPDAGGEADADEGDASGPNDWVGNGIENCGAGNPPTMLSGVVTIPSGELPLPGVAVYVPRSEPASFSEGAECLPCDGEEITDYWVKSRTNLRGEFLLTDVPAGTNVELVMEVGKWRRQVTVPEIPACEHTVIDDPDLTRLPRNQDEGHMPQFAVTTGEFDALECLMRRIGIDDSEFTPEDQDGRVHLFAGRGGTDRYQSGMNDGAAFTRAWEWWGDLNNLLDYDIIMHSCEGSAYMDDKRGTPVEALQDFTERGGRVFLSHWHNGWLREGTEDFRSVANWMSMEAITGMDLEPETGFINIEFDKGLELREWMYETGTTPRGEFPIVETRGSIESVNPEYSQEWVWIEPSGFDAPFLPPEMGDLFPDPPDEMTQYFSFNTPINAPEDSQCGRVVFSDIHVAAGNSSSVDHPFPSGCVTGSLTPQEKALVFMLFDLARCISPDKKAN